MQRFSAASCGGGVGNSAVGGASSRDTARADSSFASSSFALNSRRQLQITPYKLKCDKEPLSSRLGPPDFYPQTPNCPEETLTNDYANHGYREIAEGIEESREILLTQHGIIDETRILKCKEAIRKCLRAINESRTQKRKAGQVYEVPLAGQLLLKPGVFPEQRPCTEDFRKKWIEGLSQQHKRLHSLADHVPHGYRRRSLFEVLIRHNVPLLRATWFIKITYLNQVRPVSTGVSSGSPDKTLLARTELWTKDVIEYLQQILDEFLSKDSYISTQHGRDHSSQMPFSSALQRKDDSQPILLDCCEEPSLQFKWWYMVRILQWHHAEGLVLSSHIIEWVLKQLQEKESIEALQLFLPVIFDMIESIMLSQTYVRTLVDMAIRFINDLPSPDSRLPDNFYRSYILSALVELVRYLIVSVPDTFVALDCFPLPLSVVSDGANCRNPFLKDFERVLYVPEQIINNQYISFGYIASSIQKRAASLATGVSPSLEGYNVAKAVQSLDKSLVEGDVRVAYSCLFENLCDGGMEEGWIEEVSPCLRSCLKWIGTVNYSMVHSVFLLCEWATCDFRDSRSTSSLCTNFSGKKDFSQVYVAVQILKLWVENTKSMKNNKNNSVVGPGSVINNLTPCDGVSVGTSMENAFCMNKNDLNGLAEIMDSDVLQSPGPMHDMVVCWLDLHEPSKGEGFKRLYMLIVELIRVGIFYPPAYVRQLIVSGILDRGETLYDMNRRKRHYRILKQLPGPFLLDALEEPKIVDVPLLNAAVNIYSNERRLVLQGQLEEKHNYLKNGYGNSVNPYTQKKNNASKKHSKVKVEIAEVRAAISTLLGIPNSGSMAAESQLDVTQANNLKRSFGSIGLTEGTPGCEECIRFKRQKVNEDKLQVLSPNPSDDEDTWWVRKGPTKLLDSSFKMDPPKLTKHAPRGRQKNVRKTQSLAQLAAARIEGSQGASTSHVCDNKISCPHHRSGTEGEASKYMDGIRSGYDLVALGKALKQLRLLEKRSITLWLISTIKQLLEGVERAAAKVGHFGGPYPPAIDERSAVRWKLGEEELSVVLYLLDVSCDLSSAVKFLLWLLPRALMGPSSTVHTGRNILMMPKNTENRVFDVGEPFILSAIRRYENILIAGDLLPEYLSAAMHRAIAVMASSGRASSSAAFIYARNVLKRFGSIASVVRWEKNFKATCDQRLLAELETGRVLDSELGFSPIGFPAGVEDVDDYFRQKITNRLSRAGPTMKDIVQRHVEEALHYYLGKERKLFSAANATTKSTSVEKLDDGFHIAQQITFELLECIRQNGGAAQEGDPSLVAAAVSAVISNVGSAIAKMPDFTTTSNFPSNFSSNITALNCARRILNIHISCLSLLKEALGDRQSRVFQIALATEAFSIVSAALASSKSQARSQFQLSPETHDANSNISNEILNNSTKVFLGRASKAAAAVSALVIGAVVHGITNLERMVSCFKLKEGLDVLQFIRGVRSISNGVSRTYKVDNGSEAYVHWFRILIGNFRTVLDGLVVELLGEPYALALSRMQRILPINLVFAPAYSIFGMVVWRPYIFNSNIAMREDIQLYQSLSLAISEAVKHQPFRDICLRDSHAFYEHLSTDVSDAEFAAMLETHSSDKHSKMMAFVPLRARLFLNAVLDCKMPQTTMMQDDGSRIMGHGESKAYRENQKKLLDQLVHVLDTLQPAKFHWQWVELRLLLNEQVLMEKIEAHNMSLVEAIRSLSPNSDNFALSENENNFMDIVLTRLLVRPDAAPLYSEAVHLLGRSLEESLLKLAKWLLAGNDVLLGRKSIRQPLINVAQQRSLSTKAQFWKPWGWSKSGESSKNDKIKVEASAIEEGEFVEDGMEFKRSGKPSIQMFDVEGCNSSQQYVTEKALAELVLPCIDRSSSDSRNTFANDLIKQMNMIEQYISGFTRGVNKQPGMSSSGAEGTSSKIGGRKGIRGGSPGMGRRAQGVADLPPSSAVALRASMWLRLEFLLRLLPIIYADRESSARNMRHMLASVLLRLLGSRVVYEDADMSLYSNLARKFDVDSIVDVSLSSDHLGDSLFDRFLCVLHGLVSRFKPVWMKSSKSTSKSTDKSPRDFPVLDREVAESLQAELDRMQLPTAIRWRIQAAMPMLPPSVSVSISCQAPMITSSALSMMQSSISVMGLPQFNASLPLRNLPVSSSRPPMTIASSKSKSIPQQDMDLEIDPWLLLEDGTGSGPSPGTGGASVGDHANLKANNWLKGAVRIRRTDLTYIGAMDDDT